MSASMAVVIAFACLALVFLGIYLEDRYELVSLVGSAILMVILAACGVALLATLFGVGISLIVNAVQTNNTGEAIIGAILVSVLIFICFMIWNWWHESRIS